MGTEGKVLVMKRIEVRYRLEAPEEHRDVVERIHSVHAEHCPVARSIRDAIEIETSVEIVEPGS